jgi:hypothetical protein
VSCEALKNQTYLIEELSVGAHSRSQVFFSSVVVHGTKHPKRPYTYEASARHRVKSLGM